MGQLFVSAMRRRMSDPLTPCNGCWTDSKNESVAFVKSTNDDRLLCAHTMRFSSFSRLCVQQKTKIAWCEPGLRFTATKLRVRANPNPIELGTLSLTLKQTFTQYPAIHTNYSLSSYAISNKKDFNRSSDFLVIN